MTQISNGLEAYFKVSGMFENHKTDYNIIEIDQLVPEICIFLNQDAKMTLTLVLLCDLHL